MDELDFNTDLRSYTLDDLFSLLNIQISETSDVVSIKQLITERTDQYIQQFTEAKRENMVVFFKEIKASLLGKPLDLDTTSQTLITYPLVKKSFTPNPSYTGDPSDPFNNYNGSGNPLHRKTITQLLNVDSRFRSNYENTTSTDYLIDMPYTLQHVTEMKVSDVEIPTNYYPISETLQNNYFWISAFKQGETEPHVYYIYIPSGNYYYMNLVSYINQELQSLEDGLPISMEVDMNYENGGGVGNGTGKTTIGVITDVDISNNATWNMTHIHLHFDVSPIDGLQESSKVFDPLFRLFIKQKGLTPHDRQFGWMLGYRKAKYQGDLLLYQSESVMNLLGPQYMYLIVNDFNKNRHNHFIGTSREGLLRTDIIARISIKSPVFNLQVQNDFSVYAETREYFGPVKIQKLRIQLVDEYGRFIDLNQCDFSFTLRITSIYSAT